MLPKLSIIIPCYNHGQYLREALDSVEACPDKDLYEIIILNDGSTDKDTISLLQQLSTEGYQVINQQNQGLGAARNNAIAAARGIYVLPLDSDNRIRPAYIYESIKILDEQPAIAVVYGDAEFFGDKTGRNNVGEFNLQKMMLGNYIDACAVYRKSVWETLGGYDEKMPVMGLEDWDLWLHMAFKNYAFKYVPQVMYDYRVLGNSMLRSIDHGRRTAVKNYMEEKYKKHLHYRYINELILDNVQKNKKLILKLILAIYFPALLNYLKRKGVIKSIDFFL